MFSTDVLQNTFTLLNTCRIGTEVETCLFCLFINDVACCFLLFLLVNGQDSPKVIMSDVTTLYSTCYYGNLEGEAFRLIFKH